MLPARLATLAVIVSLAVLAAGQETAVPSEKGDGPPASCQVTLPDGKFSPQLSTSGHGELSSVGSWYGRYFADGVWYGTEKLWTVLPRDGIWRGEKPVGRHDFAYGNKLPWGRSNPPFRHKDDPLTITGKRLDGRAPVFTETEISSGLGPDYSGEGIMGGIDIPVLGCWQITGHYKDAELTFTVWVTQIHDGDDWNGFANATPAAIRNEPGEPPRRISLDGETQAKALVYKVAPQIPREAAAAGMSGPVLLHAIISTSGRPEQVEYISGPPQLAQAAINAVGWWQYRVEMMNEEAVEVDTTIEVEFPQAKNGS